MRILIATDAWRPQVNGVVHTLENLSTAARALGVDTTFLTPEGFASAPMPTYPEIRLALASWGAVARRIEAAGADHIHIATEGPIGFAARRYCLRSGLAFTTSYHTRFPEYISARAHIPESWSYAALRRFHAPAAAVMAPTPSMASELTRRGFARVKVWSRGVDHALFQPGLPNALALPRPIFLSVGRVAVEKNLEAFLRLDLPGSKVVVGDGPARASLAARYLDAHFLGPRSGAALAQTYASADVFVFPSRTDTFGIVMIEALASGLPVAAYPVPGPLDVIGASGAGALDEDLRAACLTALRLPRERARAHSLGFTWDQSARQFVANIVAGRGPTHEPSAANNVAPGARLAARP